MQGLVVRSFVLEFPRKQWQNTFNKGSVIIIISSAIWCRVGYRGSALKPIWSGHELPPSLVSLGCKMRQTAGPFVKLLGGDIAMCIHDHGWPPGNLLSGPHFANTDCFFRLRFYLWGVFLHWLEFDSAPPCASLSPTYAVLESTWSV